ncbi:ectoine utilization protein EutA [Shewanella hanedai]|uniref:Asp/Glu racemase n=1 Tax=Shewanella hanedai TaxID=25 RepID=A0A553JQ41_SHEHA|nr:aspartate/glutamate racemase family protein [Shewanella hanedai]TRY14594.1 Asp/Glu racemase [Shewanella hanedai]GGI77806.1 ectoine utilization protein EutA [Shewanella hanedai]
MNFEQFNDFEVKLTFEPAPRPQRVHIGLVQLANDHTLETDWSHLLGEQAALFSTRIFKENGMTPEALDSVAASISDGAVLVADGLPMDVMAFACTSASIIIGEQKVSKLLTKGRGDIPTTNPWSAAQAAFKHLQAKRVAVFSPYPTEVNFPLREQLIDAGFDVVAITALGIMDDNIIHKVPLSTFEQGIEILLKDNNVDVIFMSCTSLRAVENIQHLEDKYGVAVVSSNSALFWHSMHLCGQTANCPGYGKLLSGI